MWDMEAGGSSVYREVIVLGKFIHHLSVIRIPTGSSWSPSFVLQRWIDMLGLFGTNGPPLRQKNEVTGPLFLKFFAGSWNQSVHQITVRLYLGQALPEQRHDEAHDIA